MAEPVLLISGAGALLHLLRQSPATRIVLAEAKKDRRGRPIRSVVDWPDDLPPTITTLAYLCLGSEADALVTTAIRAEASSEESALWARLPIRFHDFFGACMLPEHPYTPRRHGGWGGLWTEPAEGALCAEDLTEEEMMEIGREVSEKWERSQSSSLPDSGGTDDIPI